MTEAPTLVRVRHLALLREGRWALDHLGIAYQLRHLPPGGHFEVAKRLGASASSLPLLVADGRVVQGSGANLDWADAQTTDASRRLAPEASLAAEGRALEQRLDEVAAVDDRVALVGYQPGRVPRYRPFVSSNTQPV